MTWENTEGQTLLDAEWVLDLTSLLQTVAAFRKGIIKKTYQWDSPLSLAFEW